MQTFSTRTPEETQKIAADIAGTWRTGQIICLTGELGAGKTTFVKGAAAALGVTEEITSPTFTLMNTYPIKKPALQNEERAILMLVHIDTYRLKNEDELRMIGAEDYIGQPDTLTIVEWPEKIPGLLSGRHVVSIRLSTTDPDKRTITIEAKNNP